MIHTFPFNSSLWNTRDILFIAYLEKATQNYWIGVEIQEKRTNAKEKVMFHGDIDRNTSRWKRWFNSMNYALNWLLIRRALQTLPQRLLTLCKPQKDAPEKNVAQMKKRLPKLRVYFENKDKSFLKKKHW